MIRIFLFVILLSTPFWVATAYRRTVHPFRAAKCWIEHPVVPDWEVAASPEVVSILERPFHYLGKGGQNFVFLSEDGRYVLKLFRVNNCPIPYARKWRGEWDRWRGTKPRYCLCPKEEMVKTLESCHVAYERAQEQTGLVYLHLNPKEGLPLLQVFDRLGRKHQIDPARYRFALQKKVEPFGLAYRREGEAFIASYKSLLRKLEEVGVISSDLKLEDNFGCLEGKAVIIDFGTLIYAPEKTARQTAHFEEKLSRWIERHPR